jgi:hypothetical protein
MAVGMIAGCDREPRVIANTDTSTIEERYGLSSYMDRVPTAEGAVDVTVIPVTLSDGRTAQLVVPQRQSASHRVFLREGGELYPVVLNDSGMSREEFVQSEPRIVERVVERPTTPRAVEPKKKRSLEKEILIVAGSAGAGAAIGALAGGGKGAAIGAASGGVAGLIYDLATRDK